ncbi:MAG: M14 family metallopeptidase [Bacteroidia bacterium]
MKWVKKKSVLFVFLLSSTAWSQNYLPPVPAWKGKSQKLQRASNDAWACPFEKSDGLQSATYDEMLLFFRQMIRSGAPVHEEMLCMTASGVYVPVYYFSKEWPINPEKPLMLAQGGIHAGEIDGMDAGMMLFRDLAFGQLKDLAPDVTIAFVPVLNVEGFLDQSETHRINQRGPKLQGWRSNSLNLNLNRDYVKTDSPEIRGMVALIDKLNPDVYLDIHVTDGADYQYDITYGFVENSVYSPQISGWLQHKLRPAVDQALQKMRQIPGNLVFLRDEARPEAGNMQTYMSPRFSNAYADVRHTPGILVENHSLKPFKQRVLGTRVFLEAVLRMLVTEKQTLRAAIKADATAATEPCVLTWAEPEPTDSVSFLGVKALSRKSTAAGGDVTTWNAEPYTCTIPVWKNKKPAQAVNIPLAYAIPANRKEVVERMKSHGIQFTSVRNDSTVNAESYSFDEVSYLGKMPFQGHMRLQAKNIEKQSGKRIIPKGTLIVSTAQPLRQLICFMLEPASPESFFQWGFFPDVAELTEYFELYAMAPIADKMMEERPDLKKEFEAKCAADKAFNADKEARLRWWYMRSDYADKRYLQYPVYRLIR